MAATFESRSFLDVMHALYTEMCERNFAIMQVGESHEDRGWAYTVGFVERFEHPEVLIAGYPLSEAVEILEAAGRLLARGRRIDRSRSLLWGGEHSLGLVKVDPSFLEGDLLAAWYWIYGDDPPIALSALQLVLPDGACCYQHQTTQPLFGRLRRRRRPRTKRSLEDPIVIRLPPSASDDEPRASVPDRFEHASAAEAAATGATRP